MRLFFAAHPDPRVLGQLELAQKWLAAKGKAGRYPPLDLLHLTLVFLGEQPESALPDLMEAMEEAAKGAGQRLGPKLLLSGAGHFNGRKGLLWFAELARDPSLMELQQDLAVALEVRGVSLEGRRFLPHITLARGWTQGMDPTDGRELGLLFQGTACPVSGISLMESRQNKGGLSYQELGYARISGETGGEGR